MKRYKDLTDFPAESWLQINNCNIDGSTGSAYSLLRPDGRKDHYLFYIVDGWVDIEIGGRMTRVGPHNFVFYPPWTHQQIWYPAVPELSIYYVHFTGAAADEAMRQFTGPEALIRPVRDHTMAELLFRQLRQSVLAARLACGRLPVTDLKANGLLLQLIALMTQQDSERPRPEHDAIMSAMLYISEHFRENIALEQCAANAHLSLGRFSHLFRELMGVPPHQFILSRRIDEAKELLRYSSMTVSEIAKSVGFDDPSYFSRVFRRHTGHPPTDYRSG
ncbi:MAG: helix-turn-helix transcriptional regulator [Oscillospiraceae bacterium]|nr:helix-turn-helix transcriptional regulator [Oscillospiraceae bacterium]